jgi:hypothetical protein
MNPKIARTRRFILVLIAAISLTLSLPSRSQLTSAAKTVRRSPPVNADLKVSREYGNLPLSFEPNHGQSDSRVKFLSRGAGHSLYLTSTEAWLSLRKSQDATQMLRMTVVGGNRSAKLSGEAQLPGRTNYLTGKRSEWKTDLPTFAKVRAHDVYKGIDLVYYGSDQRHFEYDFVVAPGADPKQIRISFAGAKSIQLDDAGALRLDTEAGEVVQPAPYIYQEIEGQRRQVNGKFVLSSGSEVLFDLGEYDVSRTLVIDPQLVYSSYFGGSGDDRATSVAVDAAGNAYVTGSTLSADLILNPSLQANQSGMDAFVVKVNPTGTQILYATYLGGNGTDFGQAIAVTADGRAFITGGTDVDTNPFTFPLRHEYQDNPWLLSRGLDVFVTVLTSSGDDVTYSSFLGGDNNDAGSAIALDAAENIYLTGFTLSRDFPTKNAFEDHNDYSAAFVAKFNPREEGRHSLIYSTFLRGDEFEEGTGIAVTSLGVAFVCGYTESRNFPVRSASSLPAFQTNYGGGVEDGFIAKLSPAGQLIYSTYYGGDAIDRPTAIAVDENERSYITGHTTSSAQSFPFRNAFDATRNASSETFVAKFNADGTTLFYSSLITASDGNNQGTGIAIDDAGSAYITGLVTPRSVAFPEINGFPANVQSGQTFLVKVGPSDATGSIAPTVQVSDSVRSGAPAALALDPRGNIYIVGSTSLSNIATPGAFQQNFNGTNDAFILKITSARSDTIGTFRPASNLFSLRNSNTAGVADLLVEFGQAGDLPVAGDWDGNGVSDVGVFRPSRGQFLLRVGQGGNTFSIITINFGAPGDLPVAGDWDGDGIDTPGVFRPGSVGNFLLTNSFSDGSAPSPDIVFNFGVTGDLPVAGDWNGDTIDTVGVFRPGAPGGFFLANQFQNVADIFFNFGSKGDLPLAGDWTGKGFDTVGVFRPGKSTMFLANNFVNVADISFVFGQSGDSPVAGDWDGK